MPHDSGTAPWDRFSCRDINGNPIDISGAINSLRSENVTIRKKALDSLVECLCDRYEFISEVTAYVIPDLIKLVQENILPDRGEILSLLDAIASDYSYSSESQWKLNAVEATRAGVPSYIDLLKHGDDETRRQACRLLARFTDDAELIAPELLLFVNREQDTSMQVDGVWCFADLISQSDLPVPVREHYVRELVRRLEESKDKRLRLATAVGIARIAQEATPDTVVNLIVESFADPDSYSFHTSWGDLLVSGGRNALLGFGIPRGLSALIQVLKVMLPSGDSINDTGMIVSTLLALVFNEGQYRRFIVGTEIGPNSQKIKSYVEHTPKTKRDDTPLRYLTDDQRTTLTAILETDKVWEIQSNLLTIYGLPASREGLKELLENL